MKIIIIIVTFIALLCGYAYFSFTQTQREAPIAVVPSTDRITDGDTTSTVPNQIADFINEKYNFTFKYRIKPYGYSVFENLKEENVEQETLFGVTLIRSQDYNESVTAKASGMPHDGPRTITVAVYDALGVTDLTSWLVKNNMATNCTEGTIVKTTIDGKSASSCLWDGLYIGVTIALLHDNKIYMLSGTRDDEEANDGYGYKKDFEDVVATFKITK